MGESRSDAALAGRTQGWGRTIEAGEEHFLFEACEPFLRPVMRERDFGLSGRGRPEERVVHQLIERISSPLQRILDLLPQAAAILDNHGAVLSGNGPLARLCGVSPKAWGEMPLEWHLADDSRRRFRALRQQMRRDGQPATMRVRLRGGNEERWLSACLLTSVPDAGLFVLLDALPDPAVADAAETPLEKMDAPPVQTPRPRPTVTPSETISPGAASRTIVVLEEQAELRETLQKMLAQLGYHVQTCPDLESCVTLLRSNDALDGLLFDPWRDGATGARCLERLVELRPELPLVAYCAEGQGTAEPLWAPGVQAVLSRPTSLTELYEAWQAVFEGKTSGSAWVAIPLKAPSEVDAALS